MLVVRRFVWACLAMTGCDLVFSLDRPNNGADGAIDATARADEDGDNLPDDADPCPGLAGDNADRDLDGVGDGCDPEPDLRCQTRVLFDGFTQPNPSLIETSEWRLDNGDLVQPTTAASLEVASYPSHGPALVRAAIAVDLPGEESNRFIEIGALLGISGDSRNFNAGMSCRLLQVPSGVTSTRIVEHATNTSTANAYNGSFANTTIFELATTAQTVSCTLTNGNGGGQVITQFIDPLPAMGAIAIRTERAAARVQWIEVIAPTCP